MNTTVKFRGIELDVEFDYQPYEPDVWTLSNGDPGYPGCPESVELTEIYYRGEDFWELLEDYVDQIEELVLEQGVDNE